MSDEKGVNLTVIKEEVSVQLADADVRRSLLATTFKGLNELNMKKAVFEGMMRGFSIQDFLRKNVYAVPFGGGYALVNSIDHCRKIGMRNGVCGKDAPVFEYKDEAKKDILSCTVTVHRRVDGEVGAYSSTVFFDEYSTGKGNWKDKPHTMIAKVAEMHALRMACPEDLSQFYTEEEWMQEPSAIVTEARVEEAKKAAEDLKLKNIEKKDENEEIEVVPAEGDASDDE